LSTELVCFWSVARIFAAAWNVLLFVVQYVLKGMHITVRFSCKWHRVATFCLSDSYKEE